MKEIFAMLEKYLPLVLAGVHAANTVTASNGDKKAAVLSAVVKVADAVSHSSTDPQVQAVGALIDVAASVINALTTKAPAAPVAPAQ